MEYYRFLRTELLSFNGGLPTLPALGSLQGNMFCDIILGNQKGTFMVHYLVELYEKPGVTDDWEDIVPPCCNKVF